MDRTSAPAPEGKSRGTHLVLRAQRGTFWAPQPPPMRLLHTAVAASVLLVPSLRAQQAPPPGSTPASFPVPMRPDVSGSRVALSSDHALATAAGADVLRRGGNAMDAAVTMAAVLSVVRP